MQSLIPTLAVSDMHATLRFYTDVLGFKVDFTLPNDSGGLDHASVSRGEAALMFGPLRDAPQDGEKLGTGVVLYLTIDESEDVDALFERAKASGAKILQEPADQFWGHRDWGVTDPDGYAVYGSKVVKQVDMAEMVREAALVWPLPPPAPPGAPGRPAGPRRLPPLDPVAPTQRSRPPDPHRPARRAPSHPPRGGRRGSDQRGVRGFDHARRAPAGGRPGTGAADGGGESRPPAEAHGRPGTGAGRPRDVDRRQ
jgi:uncharacterized glyoxalase superfamily protein PhnB